MEQPEIDRGPAYPNRITCFIDMFGFTRQKNFGDRSVVQHETGLSARPIVIFSFNRRFTLYSPREGRNYCSPTPVSHLVVTFSTVIRKLAMRREKLSASAHGLRLTTPDYPKLEI